MRKPIAAAAAALAGLTVATLVAWGCGGSDPAAGLINGEAPPGVATGVTSTVALRATDVPGSHTVVNHEQLPAGTHTPVQVHPNGGTGCVQRGTVTLLVDGEGSRRMREDTCFFMPAGPATALANTAAEPAALFTTFVAPTHDGGAGAGGQAPDAIARAVAVPRTGTINGQAVPGRHANAVSSDVALDHVARDGNRYLYFLDVRAAGTRAPIHVHPYGGITCVKEGQATLFVQGGAPRQARAGQCFWMAASTPMANSNTGNSTAVLFDEFILPDQAPYWRIIEPGAEHLHHGIGDPGKLPY